MLSFVLPPRGVAPFAVLALGAIAAVGLARSEGCSCSNPPAQKSSLAWDGNAYAVAWAAPQDLGATVYVGRVEFDRSDLRIQLAPPDFEAVPVLRRQRVLGAPEIVYGDDGFMVVVLDATGKLVGVPLDSNAKPSGAESLIATQTELVCAAPGWDGTTFVAASMERTEDGSNLQVVTLDRTGAVVDRHAHPLAPGSCVLAVEKGRWAVVHRSAASSEVSLLLSTRANRLLSVPVSVASEPGAVLRLIAIDAGWLLLTSEGSRHARLTVIDRETGETQRSFRIEGKLDAASLDVASNERGVFVSWIESERVRVSAVNISEQPGARTELFSWEVLHDAVGARAVGHADQCATTWTERLGQMVFVLRAGRCPKK